MRFGKTSFGPTESGRNTCTLFGTDEARVATLNRAAPQFFRMVQDLLWKEIVLRIAPPRSRTARIAMSEPALERDPKNLKPVPKTPPEATFSARSLSMGLVPYALVARTVRCYFCRGERAGPVNAVLSDPVMRLASRAPVPDRRRDAYDITSCF